MIKFAYGKTLAGVHTIERSWDDIVKRIVGSGHLICEDKLDAPNILGGVTDNRGKEDHNVLSRTLVTLDYDGLAKGVTLDDVQFEVDMLGCSAIVYTTHSHTLDKQGVSHPLIDTDGVVHPENSRYSRVRIIIPLESAIPPGAYPAAVREIADQLDIGTADACSYVIAQIMFLPACAKATAEHAWAWSKSADPYPVNEDWADEYDPTIEEDDDGFLMDIAYEPLDFTDEEVDTALEMLDPEGLDYDAWLNVGLALWHQYRGDKDAGFSRWMSWSQKSSKHDPKMMKKKWSSAGGRKHPITMASVMSMVGGASAVRGKLGGAEELDVEYLDAPEEKVEIPTKSSTPTVGALEKIMAKAKTVDSLESYVNLKKALVEIPASRLGADYRGMIAQEIYVVFGKENGLTKTSIAKAIQPKKVTVLPASATTPDDVLDCYNEDFPEWLRGWVYDQTDNEFVSIDTGHAMKQAAFRMTFDRKPECTQHEMDAIGLVSRMFPIPTVSGRMYWPGQPQIFHYNNLVKLNSWDSRTGVTPAEKGSFEIGDTSPNGEACRLFLEHLENLIEGERERTLFLDWMAWVYANPGSRVRWATLLWGVEGNGKSYFMKILGELLGNDAAEINPSSIEERFTGWAEGKRLIGIEEIRISGSSKWRTMDKLKTFISNDRISVEGKGKDVKTVPNFASYMMFTNHLDAIPLTDGDRRYFIIFSRQTTKAELIAQHGGVDGVSAYFARLFDGSVSGLPGIARMLLDHVPSGEFDPNGRAPDSEAKEDMKRMNISSEDDALSEALERYRGPLNDGKILSVTQIGEDVMMDGYQVELPKTSMLSRILADRGYRRFDRVKLRGTYHTVWYVPSMIKKDEVRDHIKANAA